MHSAFTSHSAGEDFPSLKVPYICSRLTMYIHGTRAIHAPYFHYAFTVPTSQVHRTCNLLTPHLLTVRAPCLHRMDTACFRVPAMSLVVVVVRRQHGHPCLRICMSIRLHVHTYSCMYEHLCMLPCTQTCTRKWWIQEAPELGHCGV